MQIKATEIYHFTPTRVPAWWVGRWQKGHCTLLRDTVLQRLWATVQQLQK